MNTILSQNSSGGLNQRGRRQFLKKILAISTSVASLSACEGSEYQTKKINHLAPNGIQASRLNTSTLVLSKLEKTYLYLLQEKYKKNLPNEAIWKLGKNKNVELSVQMGQTFENMGQDCMLLVGKIGDKDFRIYFDLQSKTLISTISDISPMELDEILDPFFKKSP